MKLTLPSRQTPATAEDERRIEALEARAAQAAAGDTDAMGDLYETLHDPTYRWVYAQVRNEHLAQDLTGKAWMKIVHKIDGYTRIGAGFPSWVFTIVKNTVTDEFRSAHTRREIPVADMFSAGGATRLVSQDATPEETVLDAERVDDLREDIATALASLPKNQRRALTLRFWDCLDVTTVASVMQMTPANVRNLQSRGTRRLKTLLPNLELPDEALHSAHEKVITNAPQATATQR